MNTEELALDIIRIIAENPDNRYEDGSVNWDNLGLDLYVEYEGQLTDEDLDAAIEFIFEAATYFNEDPDLAPNRVLH